ncbi:MAG: hypothetical protein IT456_28545 [Planctomycetes bacterium]|nr:hypothetical protein [Planctomycetota bacterium]
MDPQDHQMWCWMQPGGIYKWSGGSFSYVTNQPAWNAGLAFVAYDTDRHVLAIATTVLWEWDGVSWTTKALPVSGSSLVGMTHVPGRGLLFLERSRVLEWDGTNVVISNTNHPLPQATGGLYSVSYDPARNRLRASAASLASHTFEDIWDLYFDELTVTPEEPHLGNTVQFHVESAPHANQPWVLAFAMNTYPAIPLAGLHPEPLRVLPLSADYLFSASLSNGITGFLDTQGRAQVSWPLPPLPALVGLRLFACALSITPSLTAGLVSNPVEIYIAP